MAHYSKCQVFGGMLFASLCSCPRTVTAVRQTGTSTPLEQRAPPAFTNTGHTQSYYIHTHCANTQMLNSHTVCTHTHILILNTHTHSDTVSTHTKTCSDPTHTHTHQLTLRDEGKGERAWKIREHAVTASTCTTASSSSGEKASLISFHS